MPKPRRRLMHPDETMAYLHKLGLRWQDGEVVGDAPAPAPRLLGDWEVVLRHTTLQMPETVLESNLVKEDAFGPRLAHYQQLYPGIDLLVYARKIGTEPKKEQPPFHE